MQFAKLRIEEIDYIVKYTPSKQSFVSKNKPNHIIGIQLSGSAYHNFGFQGFTLSENTIYFLNKDEDYTVDVIEKGLAFSVHFRTNKKIDTHSFAININTNNEIVLLLEKMKAEFDSKHRDSVMLSDLYKLVSIYVEQYEKKYLNPGKDIYKAIEYINTHFKEKGCVSAASDICGVSQRRFNDLFKSITGTTPNRYIVLKKIELGKKLKQIDNISITEIAEQCGFSDVYYFSKCFKDITGIAPSKYSPKDKI